jgi:L-serine/L-threonine ammonia-lyase
VPDGAAVVSTSAVLKAAAASAPVGSAAYISPFDHPLIWTGHSTLIDEIAQQLPRLPPTPGSPPFVRPSLIVCVVGGGGLLCGLAEGLERHGWSDVALVAVETEGAASLYRSVKERKLITLDGITSVAKTLGAKTVAQKALDIALSRPLTHCMTVTDAQAVGACLAFANESCTLVEPSCGAGLALFYSELLPQLPPEILKNARDPTRPIIGIVCGGNMADLNALKSWSGLFGLTF